MSIKFVVELAVLEFSMLKLGGGMMMWINTSKKSGDDGNCGKWVVIKGGLFSC